MKKILVITTTPPSLSSNNTFESIFSSLPRNDVVFHSLCFRNGPLETILFKKNYCLDENRIIRNRFKNKTNSFFELKMDHTKTTNQKTVYNKRTCFRYLLRYLRDFAWKTANRKDVQLMLSTIINENYDYIIAPADSSHYFLRMLEKIAKSTKATFLLMFWDDTFTYKQRVFSPLHYFYRNSTIRLIKKLFKYKPVFLSNSKKTQNELKQTFGITSKVLMKPVKTIVKKPPINDSVKKIIYGGNLQNGRSKTIKYLIKLLNRIEFKDSFVLDIFTDSLLLKQNSIKRMQNVHIHESVDHDSLIKNISKSDIFLMVESMSFNKKYISRLSISTKIGDCFSTGTPPLIVTCSDSATYDFVKENNIGMLCSTKKEIKETLNKIMFNNDMLEQIRTNINLYIENNARKYGNELLDLFSKI